MTNPTHVDALLARVRAIVEARHASWSDAQRAQVLARLTSAQTMVERSVELDKESARLMDRALEHMQTIIAEYDA